jgi:hypothetical protein
LKTRKTRELSIPGGPNALCAWFQQASRFFRKSARRGQNAGQALISEQPEKRRFQLSWLS